MGIEKVKVIPDQNYKTQEQEPNVLNDIAKSVGNGVGSVLPFVETKNKLLNKKEDMSKKIDELKQEITKLENKLPELKMIDENKKTTFWKRMFKVDEKEFEKVIKEYNKKLKEENKKLKVIDEKITELQKKADKLATKKLFKPEGMMLLLLNIQTREAEWYINVKSDTNTITLENQQKQILVSKDKLFYMKGEDDKQFFMYVADTDNGIAYPIEPFFDANLVYSTMVSLIANIKALRDLKTSANMNQWMKLLLYGGLALAAGYIVYKAFAGAPPKEVVQQVVDANKTIIETGAIPQ